jgi:hypothetical protein
MASDGPSQAGDAETMDTAGAHGVQQRRLPRCFAEQPMWTERFRVIAFVGVPGDRQLFILRERQLKDIDVS